MRKGLRDRGAGRRVTSWSAQCTCFLQGRGARSGRSSEGEEGEKAGQVGAEVREVTGYAGIGEGEGFAGGCAQPAHRQRGLGKATGRVLGERTRREMGMGTVWRR